MGEGGREGGGGREAPSLTPFMGQMMATALKHERRQGAASWWISASQIRINSIQIDGNGLIRWRDHGSGFTLKWIALIVFPLFRQPYPINFNRIKTQENRTRQNQTQQQQIQWNKGHSHDPKASNQPVALDALPRLGIAARIPAFSENLARNLSRISQPIPPSNPFPPPSNSAILLCNWSKNRNGIWFDCCCYCYCCCCCCCCCCCWCCCDR